MKTEIREIGTREAGALGKFEFPVFENLDEVVEKYGPADALKLCQRAINIDVERVARDAMKGGKQVEEAQALVEAWKPGSSRGGKPTMKALLKKMMEFADRGNIDAMKKAQELVNTEGVEAAYSYLVEQEA